MQTKTINSSITLDGNASTRHFLRDDDLSHSEYCEVLELALEFENNRHFKQPFEGNQSVAVIFDKNSTRTRVSFATGVAELGGYPMVIDSATSQLSRGEPISDTAHVLERMCSEIVWRTFSQDNVVQMAKHSNKPVINSLTDEFHPCQVLSDLSAIAFIGDSNNLGTNGSFNKTCDYAKLSNKEKVATLKGKKLVYLGDGFNNMAHSYLLGGANAGLSVTICSPKDFSPDLQVVEDAKTLASQHNAEISITENIDNAIAGADIIATDAWLSMGMDKSESDARANAFSKFQVTTELMDKANDGAIFLHCLPAYRGQEVVSEVIDSKGKNWGSGVWIEAEFRLHAQKALMTYLSEISK
jgi:ornithine carbamoyltransferase